MSPKGISPLIATVIIVAFIISLGWIASQFITGYTKKTKSEIEEGGLVDYSGARLEIERDKVSIGQTIKIPVSNIGDRDLDNLKVIVYNESGPFTFTPTPDSIEVGYTKSLSIPYPGGNITKIEVTSSKIPSKKYEYEIPGGITLWWNSSFKKCQSITISSPINDYQYKLILNTTNFNYSYANNDGSDIRIVNAYCGGGGQEVPHWIEEWNESGDSTVWFRGDKSFTTTYAIYYNYTNAEPKSNGSATFQYFDHWISNNTGDWQHNGATTTYLNNHHQWYLKTMNFTDYREMEMTATLQNWWVGNWDHTNVGWAENKTYHLSNDYVSVYWEHRTSNGANSTHMFVKLKIRKAGVIYTTDLKSFPKPNTNDNISVSLKYYSDYVAYEMKNIDTGEILASDYIDNSSQIPDPSNTRYFFHQEWDSDSSAYGAIWDWISPTYVKMYNYEFNGGMEWKIDYWFIKKYTYPEPTTLINI